MIPLSTELQPEHSLVKTRVGHTGPDSKATGSWNGRDRQRPLTGADTECPYRPGQAALAWIQRRERRQEKRVGANRFLGISLNHAATFAFASGRHGTVRAGTTPPPEFSPGNPEPRAHFPSSARRNRRCCGHTWHEIRARYGRFLSFRTAARLRFAPGTGRQSSKAPGLFRTCTAAQRTGLNGNNFRRCRRQALRGQRR